MAKVLTLKIEKGKDVIKFSGTTDEGVLAVSCSLVDKDEKEVDFNSVVVENRSFSGEFSANGNATTIKCADYDGGEILSAEITTKTDEKNEIGDVPKTSASTGTSDTGLFTVNDMSYVSGAFLGVVLIVVLAGLVVFFKRKNSRKA